MGKTASPTLLLFWVSEVLQTQFKSKGNNIPEIAEKLTN